MNEKILSRIKKMLALANDAGATEGERDAALHHAYKLMAKHNLDMADLKEQEENRITDDITICGDNWIGGLHISVAKMFFCFPYCVTHYAGKKSYAFIGKESNVLMGRNMLDYLVKNIHKQARMQYKSATSPHGRSFCQGAEYALRVRIKKLIEEQKEQEACFGTGTSIVLADLYKQEEEANKKHASDMGMEFKSTKVKSNQVHMGAYNSGKVHGNNVSLHNQVTADANAQPLMIGN